MRVCRQQRDKILSFLLSFPYNYSFSERTFSVQVKLLIKPVVSYMNTEEAEASQNVVILYSVAKYEIWSL